jgi:hypothetical protein
MSSKRHILRLAWPFAVAVAGFGWGYVATAGVKDTSSQEATCKDIGFRPKTVAFADCVIKLVERDQNSQDSITTPVRSVRSRVVQSPPPSVALSPNEKTCANYGFKRRTVSFSQCVMQLDAAQQQAQAQAQQFAVQEQQYEQQVAAYQQELSAQQEAIKKERERLKWEAIGRLGAGMANSTSSSFLGALNEGLAAANGVPISRPAPEPPSPPVSQNYTIRLPNGNQVYCNYNTAAQYMSCR